MRMIRALVVFLIGMLLSGIYFMFQDAITTSTIWAIVDAGWIKSLAELFPLFVIIAFTAAAIKIAIGQDTPRRF